MPDDDTNEDDRCLQQHVMVRPNIASHMPIGVGGFVFAVFLRKIIFGRERWGPGPGIGKAASSHIASAGANTKGKRSNPAGRGPWGQVRRARQS